MAIQPVSAVGREDQAEEQYDLLAQSLKKQEESRTTLHEMIQDAKEKANDQREKFKLAKATPRYGDAPLEAYARLNRAKVLEICDLVLRFCETPISPEDILQKVFRHYQLSMDFNQYVLAGSTIRSYLSYLLDKGALTVDFSDCKAIFRRS